MRNNCNTQHNDRSADNPNVYHNWSTLPEQRSTNVTNNIDQRYNRNMESRYDQYRNSWNNNIYVYAICRSMRHNDNTNRYSQSTNNANVPAVVVLIVAGLHVPGMPLLDVVGNAGAVLF